jgi:hypothetical protein
VKVAGVGDHHGHVFELVERAPGHREISSGSRRARREKRRIDFSTSYAKPKSGYERERARPADACLSLFVYNVALFSPPRDRIRA